MSEPAEQNTQENRKPSNHNVSTVNVNETVGVVFLAIIAVLLLLAFLRSQKQLREELAKQIPDQEGAPQV